MVATLVDNSAEHLVAMTVYKMVASMVDLMVAMMDVAREH